MSRPRAYDRRVRSEFTWAIDRRLVALIRRRARRKSTVLRLLPDRWLYPLLLDSARRLRVKLLTGIVALAIVLGGVMVWLGVHA